MPRARRLRRAALAAATTLLAVAAPALVPVVASASSSLSVCAGVVVVVVRGSTEHPGAGPGWSAHVYNTGGLGMSSVAAKSVQNGHSGGVRVEGLVYPASVFPSPGSADYINSQRAGVTSLRAELEALAYACDGATKIALIGYSQGAHVVGDVLDKTTSPQLSSKAKSAIKAVVLYGDPRYRPGESFDHGGGKNIGLLGGRTAGNLSTFATRLYSYCLPGDAFCQGMYPFGQDIHGSYAASTYQSKFSSFILGKV